MNTYLNSPRPSYIPTATEWGELEIERSPATANITAAADDQRSFHRIVVGVSGSDASIDALTWAGRVGDALDVAIDAIMCWDVDRDHEFSSGPGYRPVEDARRRLDRSLTTAFGRDVPENLRAMVRRGRTARVLVDAGQGAEMLVVGTRGHSGVAALMLGSVSTYCAQHAGCPVVVTPARRTDPWPATTRRKSRAAIGPDTTRATESAT